MFNPLEAAPTLMNEWIGMSMKVGESVDPMLAHLVKIRASQINGCANCINLHTAEARNDGATNQRVDLLAAWEEAPCYSERERAALAWTETMTRLSERPDRTKAYRELRAHFTEEEQVKLTLLINVINGFNRIAVGFEMFWEPADVEEAGDEVQAA